MPFDKWEIKVFQVTLADCVLKTISRIMIVEENLVGTLYYCSFNFLCAAKEQNPKQISERFI